MAPDVASLELAARCILSDSPWKDDFHVLDLPWREPEFEHVRRQTLQGKETTGKLTFGIMSWDGNVRPHPPVQRAIRLVTDALRQHNCDVSNPFQVEMQTIMTLQVVDWDPPPHSPAVEVLVCQYLS